MYLLFLDDFRIPSECSSYMRHRIPLEYSRLYTEQHWSIVREYDEFIRQIQKHGLPSVVSFDHDLHPEHYSSHDNMQDFLNAVRNYTHPTGYECAIWLKDFCSKNNLQLPKCLVHSMSEFGTKRISQLLNL
jgi:hypothetical protein